MAMGAVLAATSGLAAPPATDGGAPARDAALRLSVDLRDGSRLVGTPGVDTLKLNAAFGAVTVPWAQVRELQMADDREKAVVLFANGDRLSAVPSLDKLEMATVIGPVTVGAEHVARVRVTGGVVNAKGLRLWNTFDSREELASSRVGPGGEWRRGRFVKGVEGQGLEVSWNQSEAVAFPKEALNPGAGCVEMWVKLVGFSGTLLDGENPALFVLDYDGGQYSIHINANDGASQGGICARAGALGTCGTGPFGSWTYERAFQGANPREWRHVALVWDRKGLPGVGSGGRKLAVFVDGRLNTGAWTESSGEPPDAFPDGELVVFRTQHLRAGAVVFDNLKVWSYAKTDFSDRFEGTDLAPR
jgi:hypothetical protein